MTKEDIQVVNEDDQVIGHKSRSEVDSAGDTYRVSALWVTNKKGDVLIAQRKLTKKHCPGKWGPAVAGTVDEGETYESNIYKEAEEEIGLRDVKFELGRKRRRYKPHSHFTQWFLVTLDRDINDFKLCEDEVEKLAWIPKKELQEDIDKNPEKYLPSMPEIVKTFSKPAPPSPAVAGYGRAGKKLGE